MLKQPTIYHKNQPKNLFIQTGIEINVSNRKLLIPTLKFKAYCINLIKSYDYKSFANMSSKNSLWQSQTYPNIVNKDPPSPCMSLRYTLLDDQTRLIFITFETFFFFLPFRRLN